MSGVQCVGLNKRFASLCTRATMFRCTLNVDGRIERFLLLLHSIWLPVQFDWGTARLWCRIIVVLLFYEFDFCWFNFIMLIFWASRFVSAFLYFVIVHYFINGHHFDLSLFRCRCCLKPYSYQFIWIVHPSYVRTAHHNSLAIGGVRTCALNSILVMETTTAASISENK